MLYRHFPLIIWFFLCVSSCKTIPQKENRSRIKTGDFNSENSLINLPDGVRLFVCNKLKADNANSTGAMKLISDSISEWAKTIDFAQTIKIEEGCPSEKSLEGAMITVSYSPQNDPNSDVCVTLGANYVVYRNSNLAWARSFSPYNHEIVLCDPTSPVTKDVIIHEVGHLFGNCDQYKIEPGNSFASQRLQHPNCGTRFGSGKGECSAMNAVGPDHPQVITRADCEIMQQMGKAYKKGLADNQGTLSFNTKCSGYPGPEKCGILAGNEQSTEPEPPKETEQPKQTQGGCPAGHYLATDGYCYPVQSTQSSCPPGTVLYTDGLCR